MTTPAGESKVTRALSALTDLARGSVAQPDPVRLDKGLQALSLRLAAAKSRRTALLRWSMVGAMATASVLGLIWFSRARQPAALSPTLAYRIEGGSVVDGGYLREAGNGGVKLFFAEGTEFVLMPGTRGRLRTVDNLGARIAIENGTASFQVTPSTDRRWLVEVGPFLVTVKGTVFAVSWDASRERFELRLRQGHVVISGPVSGGDIALRAGQRLVVNLPTNETLITEQKPEETWSEATIGPAPRAADLPQERPSPALEKNTTKATPGASLAVAKVEGDHGWSEALASGKLDRILADVDRAGVRTTLEKASSEDLFALADAARYRRRVDLAREALLAERRRFPGSARTLDAAFLLGRVEEASERRLAQAIRWYDEYLAAAPAGTYAAEALGRKMTLTSKLDGNAQARAVAEDYLRRFPNGSYAGSARALRRAP
jgi:TolA-binding protein